MTEETKYIVKEKLTKEEKRELIYAVSEDNQEYIKYMVELGKVILGRSKSAQGDLKDFLGMSFEDFKENFKERTTVRRSEEYKQRLSEGGEILAKKMEEKRGEE